MQPGAKSFALKHILRSTYTTIFCILMTLLYFYTLKFTSKCSHEYYIYVNSTLGEPNRSIVWCLGSSVIAQIRCQIEQTYGWCSCLHATSDIEDKRRSRCVCALNILLKRSRAAYILTHTHTHSK